jgi:hypothetical protein
LERGRLVTAAQVWHTPGESGGEALQTGTLNLKKSVQLQKAGRAAYWRKQKEYASRIILNK